MAGDIGAGSSSCIVNIIKGVGPVTAVGKEGWTGRNIILPVHMSSIIGNGCSICGRCVMTGLTFKKIMPDMTVCLGAV